MGNIRNIDISIVTNASGSLTFHANDIIDISIQRSLTDGSFGIGYTQSDRLTFRAASSVKLPKRTRATVYVDIDDNGNKRLGRFYVKDCTRDGSVITVTAYDAMYWQSKTHVKFGGNAEGTLNPLTFPCTMQSMLDYICAFRNITCEFQCQPFTVQKLPQKPDDSYFTVRELIGFIAACHGCNAKFDGEGHLQFKNFIASNTVITASDATAFTLDDSEPYRVTGLLFTVDNDSPVIYIDDVAGSDYDEDDIGIVKCYNPLATVEIAEYVWTKIGGDLAVYYGGSVTQCGTGDNECGDVIEVSNLKYPADEQRYQMCITDITYNISASDGFIETLSSQVLKEGGNSNGSVPSGGGGGGGSGVGEDLGNGDIRFNSSDNTVTNSNGKNTLFGANNSMTSCFGSIVGGYNNSLTNCNYTWVIGSSNTVEASRAAVLGDENTVNDFSDRGLTCGNGNRVTNGSNDDIVTGAENTLNNTRRCVVAGMNATYNNSTDSMMIAEGYQTITNLEKCYFVGENNQGAAFNASGARFAYVRDRAFKFKVDYYGNVYAHAYNTASADYAEYFEWADGNPDEEDRMGLLVDQIGDKIAPAQGDEFFGAISARASVVGNAYDCEWHGKFAEDVYGRAITVNGESMLNPDYDPDMEYIPRSQRPEWAVVGLVGRVIVRDNGKCEPGGYISARKGIAIPTHERTCARVLRRIDDSRIEVLIK